MSQNNRTPVFSQLKGGSQIEIGLGVIHYHRIEEKRLFIGRFAVLHVDLACQALHSIDYRGYALCDLDTFQPLSRNIAQAEWRGEAPHNRPVFVQHLGVDAAQAEQAYLPCTRNCVGIAHSHAGRVFKTLCQVAAGHLAKPCGCDGFHSVGSVFAEGVAFLAGYKNRSFKAVSPVTIDITGVGRFLARCREGKACRKQDT